MFTAGGSHARLVCQQGADLRRIIKLREGLPKFMRGFRDGLYQKSADFMRVSREGLV